ncbi:MAG: hypothetical protein M3437_20405 [Chloroflexota bacterium]|nr:hypothetical protein [Chloroflexota bacterium]MDQ5867780.1 hypothetical protein [Chloroflexota bacterium]
MSRPRKGILFAALVALLFLATAISLAARPTTQEPAFSAGISAQLPQPVGTYYPPTLTATPTEPTSTPSLIPPPPSAISLAPVAGSKPNIAWGAITRNYLMLWVGTYSDIPSQSLANARAVARWNVPLDLISMAVSPDGRWLALLTVERCFPPDPLPTRIVEYQNGTPVAHPITGSYCEGDWPQYIYVVDLLTNEVQHVPDYADYDLYAEFRYGRLLGSSGGYRRLLGWLDNDRFGVVNGSNQMIVATRDGVTFEPRNFPNLTGRDFIGDIDLLPDRKTLLVVVNGELYSRDVHTGVIRKAGTGKGLSDVPSPDGVSTAYMHIERDPVAAHIQHDSLWVRDLDSTTADLLYTGELAGEPVWSPDSSQIAFAAVEDRDPISYEPTSDIFVANRATKTSRRLVDFQAARNTDLRWTPGGNLLLLSNMGSSGELALVAASTADGSLTKLASPAQGEEFRQPILFDPQLPQGMPHVGAEPSQP